MKRQIMLVELPLKAQAVVKALLASNATESDDLAEEFEYKGWLFTVVWRNERQLYGLLSILAETGGSWEVKAEYLPSDASDNDQMLAYGQWLLDHPEEFIACDK